MSRARLRARAALLSLVILAVPAGAAAQAELTGTYIRYAGMGSNGTLINASSHSFQYTETASTPYSCDAFYPGSPVEGFTVAATASGTTLTATNSQSGADFSTVSGPTVSGRIVRWTGRYVSGSTQITVAEALEVQSAARNATLTVTLSNTGSTSLSNVYYLRNADPDHGSCSIGSDTSTYNDVRRQPPASTSALVTASGGSPAVVIGIGSHDTRARAHAGGFFNVDAPGIWTSPLDPAGALDDVATDIVFRETSLAVGASTTLVIHYVFGATVSSVEARFDALAGPSCGSCDDGNPCTTDSCVSGVCRHDPATGAACDDGSFCTISDACTSFGVCSGIARSCDDGDPCTSDRCDDGFARCVYDPITTGMCAPDSGIAARDAGGAGDDAGPDPGGDGGVLPIDDAGPLPMADGGALPGADGGTAGGVRSGRRGGGSCSAAGTPGGPAGGTLARLGVIALALASLRRRRAVRR